MAISIDWDARRVVSTDSILDIVAFKDAIRDLEDDGIGVLYPPVITYKRLDLGGGAYFHAVDFINSYELIFPTDGNYTIIGNIGATIVPVAGVFVDRVKSAAFATVSSGGGGLSPGDISAVADAVWAEYGATLTASEKWAKLAAVLSA
jgi:hypothetical protein